MAINFNQFVIDNFVATVAFEDINLALSVGSPVMVAGITKLVFFQALLPTVMILIVQRQRSMVDLFPGLNPVNDTRAHDEDLSGDVERPSSHELPKLRFTMEP